MNVSSFFEHWGIMENPFRAEEARQDAVFGRIAAGQTDHPDFEKILGELDLPSTSIVFGEKGSGKTAIRLQIARRIAGHNAASPDAKTLLIPYDDLNPTLDRYCAGAGTAALKPLRRRAKGSDDGDATLARLKGLRLVDHMDAILHIGVTRLVDALLDDPREDPDLDVGERPLRALRRSGPTLKRDMMLLQACYDRPEEAGARTRALRRRIHAPIDGGRVLWNSLLVLGALLPAGVAFAWWTLRADWPGVPWLWLMVAALGLWALALLKRLVWDTLALSSLARKVSRRLRVMHRSPASLMDSLGELPAADRRAGSLPVEDTEEARYAMFARLRRVSAVLGFAGILVVMDRIDEPTTISGDPDRMQAVAWPLLNNKFLQMEGVGIKLLLPIELRHSLFRESTAFFQEARLDKQNLIDRLVWTGATLFDLCNARINACRPGAGDAISLVDLFAEDVSRQDLVDALDQMRQPRDAFKFLYQCIQEHCSNVTQEQASWRIPRLVLEQTRKQQADRVQQLHRGVRPA